MPRLPCKRSSRDLVSHVEIDCEFTTCAVGGAVKTGKFSSIWSMSSLTWITEDQLRISLSSALISELRGKSLVEEGPSLKELREHVANRTRLKWSLPIP